MPDKYLLHCENESQAIGTLLVDFDNDRFEIDENPNYAGPLPFFLNCPGAVMPLPERIKLWITERAPEPNYAFIDTLVEKTGLKEYDAYGFFKYNHGRFITDKFYVEAITCQINKLP